MEMNTLRVESSLWIGNKRYRAALSGWYFTWVELDKKNREKKTGKLLDHNLVFGFIDTVLNGLCASINLRFN